MQQSAGMCYRKCEFAKGMKTVRGHFVGVVAWRITVNFLGKRSHLVETLKAHSSMLEGAMLSTHFPRCNSTCINYLSTTWKHHEIVEKKFHNL